MRSVLPLPLVLLVLLGAVPAAAEEEKAAPGRTVALTVYGDDACPKGAADEIVVCARQPESERYRIPKKFRRRKVEDAAGASWGARVQGLEEAARPMRPGSCSADGSFGQTGCTAAMLRQWFAERQRAKSDAAGIP